MPHWMSRWKQPSRGLWKFIQLLIQDFTNTWKMSLSKERWNADQIRQDTRNDSASPWLSLKRDYSEQPHLQGSLETLQDQQTGQKSYTKEPCGRWTPQEVPAWLVWVFSRWLPWTWRKRWVLFRHHWQWYSSVLLTNLAVRCWSVF